MRRGHATAPRRCAARRITEIAGDLFDVETFQVPSVAAGTYQDPHLPARGEQSPHHRRADEPGRARRHRDHCATPVLRAGPR